MGRNFARTFRTTDGSPSAGRLLRLNGGGGLLAAAARTARGTGIGAGAGARATATSRAEVSPPFSSTTARGHWAVTDSRSGALYLAVEVSRLRASLRSGPPRRSARHMCDSRAGIWARKNYSAMKYKILKFS